MHKIVLTGSSGFLGGHLKRALGEVTTIPHKLLSDVDILRYKLREGFDYLIHCAAYGNLYDQTDENNIFNCNVNYTRNLIESVKDIKFKSFIYISSSSVYGNSTMKETDICFPKTDYAKAKLTTEQIIKESGKPYTIFRPFTMYGPFDNPKHLIPTVIRSIKDDEIIKLDPYPVHDYIYVEDAVKGIIGLKDRVGETINLGSGIQTSNEKVVSLIESLLDKPALINKVEGIRSYDTDKWKADTKLSKSLGFQCSFNLIDGLNKTIYEESKS